jgi:cation transport ATPase
MKERVRENKECENLKNPPTKNTEPLDVSRRLDTISLPIWGMRCLSCTHKIEAALSALPGVAEAEVDFVFRKAMVRFDSSKVDLPTLKGAVEAAGYRVREGQEEAQVETSGPSIAELLSKPRPYLMGAAAMLGVIVFYLGLLTLASDWYNAEAEFRSYKFWILGLAIGLGVQALLFSLLRAWHKGGSMKAAKCTLAASGGVSTTAMAVCCSHYIFAFLPALGLPFLSTAAASLADYQIYFFLVGVVSNLFGIGLMIRMMDKSGMIQVGAFVSHLSSGVLPAKRYWR